MYVFYIYIYISCMTLCFIIQLYLTYFIVMAFNFQVVPSDLFGWFKRPFQGLSDLHLGDQKVTWKKLVVFHTISFAFLLDGKTFPKIPWKKVPLAFGMQPLGTRQGGWLMKSFMYAQIMLYLVPWTNFYVISSPKEYFSNGKASKIVFRLISEGCLHGIYLALW